MSYEFKSLAEISYKSAAKIVPHIINKIGIPTKVVDLGGGVGGWCRAFLDNGTSKVICIDHPSTPSNLLVIDQNDFIKCDFEKNIPDFIKCDLAISIEFAEHISSKKSDSIIDFLVQSAPIIVFSAAIPNQGGVNHINEQRHNFWANKFAERNFECLDIIRNDIIFDSDIEYYLRQNVFLFVDKNSNKYIELAKYEKLIPNEFEIVSSYILNKDPSFKQIIKMLLKKIINKIK